MRRIATKMICAAMAAFTSFGATVGSARAEPRAVPGAAYDTAAHAGHLATYKKRRAAAGDAYDARTKLSGADGGPRYVNRMILEASPYLRQHAHNPIDWRPWGEAALREAASTGKLIFLSVGYATCHWCHVMERESFDDPAVAAILNRDYVPIKVDREENPAVDETYMLAATLINGSGGWPNTLWLTPQAEPLFAATYLPKPELTAALGSIQNAWKEQPEFTLAAAAQLSQAMRAYAAHRDAAKTVDEKVYAAAQKELSAAFNELQGGFSDAVQFPLEVNLLFLLDRWRRTGDADALEMATKTLDGLVAGGVHDHAGGGFHRYAVDPEWSVPHFEKMLYNQAQIARALIEAREATGAAQYRRAAQRAMDYVLRDLRAPGGAFHTAEDADSRDPDSGKKREGAFYLWTPQSLSAALGSDGAEVAKRFGVGPAPLIEGGSPLRVDQGAIGSLSRFDAALETLRKTRERRPHPFRDEKIIAGWNGLTIRALAEASAAFDRTDYLEAADRAMQAIWSALWRKDRLLRFDGGDAPAALDDYAWLGLASVALYDATGSEAHLRRARLLAETARKRFADGSGRYKLSEADGPLGPVYQQGDASLPAGESSMLELLALLSQREQKLDFRGYADELLAALSGGLAARPTERLTALRAAALLQGGESGARRTLSTGVVRAAARRKDDRVEIALELRHGWHVNAHKPRQPMLVPTELTGPAVGSVAYPKEKEVALGFSDEPLAVLEGSATLVATLKEQAKDSPVALSLVLQACSDKICLAPEQALFRLGPAGP